MAIADYIERLGGIPTAAEEADRDAERIDVDLLAPDDLSDLDGPALDPDPRPARRRKGRMRAASSSSGTKASAAQKRQIRDSLLMILTPTTGLLALKDPICAGTAFAQREAIADAMVPIVARNPAMLAFFSGGEARWLDYLALATALQPVAGAVWHHHVRHDVGGEPEDEGGDPLDYSAYTA